ncbi:MAG: oligoendopeptidase F [Caldilineales bacterium]
MTEYDVAVAWNWHHDAGFIGSFRQACEARSLSVLEITPDTLDAATQALGAGQLAFRSFMNRAADTDTSFLSLVRWAREHGAFRINPHEQETYTADKATMHLELISAGLHTPYTIILAPVVEQPTLPALDLSPLGDSFAIKPALGGGGQGVVLEATNHDQVQQARQLFPHDKYLVQAHVEPKLLDGRPAWFRVIYCVGEVFVSWWPPETHVYHPVTKEDVVRYGLGALYDMAVRIADVCRLHLFSTEIALTRDDQFLAVDYVNDQIDLRLQSQAVDGVPDAIVQEIGDRLAGLVADALDQTAYSEGNLPVANSQLRTRDQIAAEYKWNRESVFATVADWEAELASLGDSLAGVSAFAGRLADGPATLADALDAIQSARQRLGVLYVYAGMDYAVDTNDQAAGARMGKVQGLAGRVMAAVSFLNPELLAIGRPTLDRWMAAEPRLALLAHYTDNLFRQQQHVRSAEVEELLGLTAETFGGIYNTFTALTDSDLPFKPALGNDGGELPVSQSTINGILHSGDREARRTAWEHYTDSYLAYKNTLASNLATSVRRSVFTMRARRYDSTLEAALFQDNIPVAVFTNLIDTFRKHLPTWHRYWRLRRKALGVEVLHPYDIWAPLVTDPPRIPFGQAVDWICDALAPLGDDYVQVMRQGCLEDRWIDVYPNKGKGNGAFSSGSPGTYPFIMMSYADGSGDLGTLAHELGHSMHSWHVWQNQPPLYSDYTIFAAEVASNFHQAMMRGHLLSLDLPRDLQIAIIEEAMSNFHRYFLVMPTLARFELAMHQRIEQGEGITADDLIHTLADLFAEGYGDEMHLDRQRVGIGWATFPHLYTDYYVFQYATGISGANALARRILAGTPGAAEDYRRFLSAGDSMYAIDSLKLAGVDLSTPEPVEETYQVLSGLLDRLEALLAA